DRHVAAPVTARRSVPVGARPRDASFWGGPADAPAARLRMDGKQADDGPPAWPTGVSIVTGIGKVRDRTEDAIALGGDDQRRVCLSAPHVANLLAVGEHVTGCIGRDILLVRGHHDAGHRVELVGTGVSDAERRRIRHPRYSITFAVPSRSGAAA